ncbi:uncharacterized protein LOC117224175 isoform X2 [Megalopta genalis]|uniref:uncharacterized protein LOC117224175 isoform X2 n=1 Tax=Megalopta genalis TaxID=115081 RepID=UPI003FD0FC35
MNKLYFRGDVARLRPARGQSLSESDRGNGCDRGRVQNLLLSAPSDEPLAFRQFSYGESLEDIFYHISVDLHLRSDFTNSRQLYLQEYTFRINVWFTSVIVLLSIRRYCLYVSNSKSRRTAKSDSITLTRNDAAEIHTIRFIFEHLQSDFSTLRNPTELEILSKHAHSSRRVVYGFLCIACGSFAYVHLIIAGPLILDVLVPMNEPRDNGLQSFGFFVSTDNKNIYWVACIFLLSAMTGVITIICSESTLFVISQYCCGLFEIANYRFTNMIYETVHKPDNPRQRYFMRASMREAVEIHTKAINFVRIFGYDARLPYLIAIVVVVVSMSLNLYRSILAMTEKDDMKNMCNALIIGIIHVVAVFMGNYIGQEVIDNSVAIFHDIYNSLWYYCPVKMQKMVLLIMQRSISGSMLDFSGLFCPSNKGFATMMSSSFSYFTTICSLKGNV